MDGQEFANRLTQVRQAMRDQGLQTLLVHDSGRHNFLRMNYVAYLTDFISVGPETMLVIPWKMRRCFISRRHGISRARKKSRQVKDVRPFKELLARGCNECRQGRLDRP